jgi:hypothetical protein
MNSEADQAPRKAGPRLATLAEDHWALRENPDWKVAVAPAFQDVGAEQLPLGQCVKLVFEMELLDDGGEVLRVSEGMWVAPVDRIGEVYIGILANEPHFLAKDRSSILIQHMELPFLLKHVFDYHPDSEEDAAWVMALEPSRTWPRNYE